MKRVLLLLVALAGFTTLAIAGAKDKKAPHEAFVDSTEVKWLTIDEVQVKMHDEPRQVYIDVYTDWCGWCKRMDATTFKNPKLIRYMNQHFYAVKFNAERTDTIRFNGHMYGFEPQYKANGLVVDLMHQQMSYPTAIVFLDKNFQTPTTVPGYHDVKEMESILRYFGDNTWKTTKWETYQQSFKPTWAAN